MLMNLVPYGRETSLHDRYRVRQLETRIDLLEKVISGYVIEQIDEVNPHLKYRATLPDGSFIYDSSKQALTTKLYHILQEQEV